MKNKTIILALILSISLTSAFYSGETIMFSNELNLEDLDWTIVNNNSEITILPEITINQTNITIFFPYNMPPNKFDIVFIEPNTREVVKTIYSSGGGGGTKTITKEVLVNQTVYVDRNITKEIPIEKEIEVEKIVEVTKKENKMYMYLILIVFLIMGIFLGFILFKRKMIIEDFNHY